MIKIKLKFHYIYNYKVTINIQNIKSNPMGDKDNKANKNLPISSLEKIDEKNELYESINEAEEEETDPNSKIAELQQKIISLEKLNKDLHSKNEGLTKNNNLNSSILLRMSLVGPRRKLRASQRNFSKVNEDSIKLAEIMKEKDDLQQMNEKMLDLLTDKELENEDLLQKFENYKLETKIENDKNLEKIQSLEEKIAILENSKADPYIDDIINEYTNYKERLKRQLNECARNEENLKQQIDMKDRTIQKLNEEIQGLEIENLQLINQSERKDKLTESEILDYEQMKSEYEKIKREIQILDEKLKLTEKNRDKDNKSHEDEIIEFQKKIENEQNDFKIYKDSKNKEIDLLKNELTRTNRDINIYSKKIDSFEKILDDEKKKNLDLQNKLEKKIKELQDMNEYTKKLLSNKDNILTQYEEKIEEMNKNKNDLITQNKELLEKLKTKNEESSASNLGEILNEDEDSKEELQRYMQENKLLNEEINSLKQQLDDQANDLVDLDSLDKELERLRAQNEDLIKDNEKMKKDLDNAKKEISEKRPSTRRMELTQSILDMTRKTTLVRKRTILEKNMDSIKFEKQMNAFKKVKDDEKAYFEKEIERLNLELAELKINALNKQYETDSLLAKYKNCMKTISAQCKKKGIKLKINEPK